LADFQILMSMLAAPSAAPGSGAGRTSSAPSRAPEDSFGRVLDRVNSRVQQAASEARSAGSASLKAPAAQNRSATPEAERTPDRNRPDAPQDAEGKMASPGDALRQNEDTPSSMKEVPDESVRAAGTAPEAEPPATLDAQGLDPVLTGAGLERLTAFLTALLSMDEEQAAVAIVRVSGGKISSEEARLFLKTLEAWLARSGTSIPELVNTLPEPPMAAIARTQVARVPAETLPPSASVEVAVGAGSTVPRSSAPVLRENTPPPTWKPAVTTVPAKTIEVPGEVLPNTQAASPDLVTSPAPSVGDLVNLLKGSDAGRVVLRVSTQAAQPTALNALPASNGVLPATDPVVITVADPAPKAQVPTVAPPPGLPLESPSTRLNLSALPEVHQARQAVEQKTGVDLYRQAVVAEGKSSSLPEPTSPVPSGIPVFRDAPAPATLTSVVQAAEVPVMKTGPTVPVLLTPEGRRVEPLSPRNVHATPEGASLIRSDETSTQRIMPSNVPAENAVSAGRIPDPAHATLKAVPGEQGMVDWRLPSKSMEAQPVPFGDGVTMRNVDPKQTQAVPPLPMPDAVAEAGKAVVENVAKNTTLVEPRAVRPNGLADTMTPASSTAQAADRGVKSMDPSAVTQTAKQNPSNSLSLEVSEPRDGAVTWGKTDVMALSPTATYSPKAPIQPFQIAPQEVDPVELVRQISNQVQAQMARTHTVSRLSFQLIPESLGRVTIQVAVVDQTVTARILVASPEVREALQHHMVELRTSLNQAGLQIDNLQVHIQGGSGQGLAMYYEYQREGFAQELRDVAGNIVENEIPDNNAAEPHLAWGRMNLVNVLV